MNQYEDQILAEYEAAVTQLRKALQNFLSQKGRACELSGGGSVDGAYAPFEGGSNLLFIAFAWGVTAEDAAKRFAGIDPETPDA